MVTVALRLYRCKWFMISPFILAMKTFFLNNKYPRYCKVRNKGNSGLKIISQKMFHIKLLCIIESGANINKQNNIDILRKAIVFNQPRKAMINMKVNNITEIVRLQVVVKKKSFETG